jgi:hypothetical protein
VEQAARRERAARPETAARPKEAAAVIVPDEAAMEEARTVLDFLKHIPPDAPPLVSVAAPLALPTDKRVEIPRAHRWTPADLPWLTSVHTGWGLELRVLNISASGMLVESYSKFVPNRSTEFRLSGPSTNLVVPARVVRSEIGMFDAKGVKFHAAAAFHHKLQLVPESKDLPALLDAPSGLSRTQALAELRLRMAVELAGGEDVALVREMFEGELRRLLPALQIKIGSEPLKPAESHESIYFTVPNAGDPRAVLQVIFGPDHRPAPEEFRFLKEAAAAAAVFAPYDDGTASNNSW